MATNYWKPFSEDVTRLAKAGVDLIRGKKAPDAGSQLMGTPWKTENKASQPAHGIYDHNSPAKPL